MRSVRVTKALALFSLLALAAVAPASAYTKCFSYKVIVSTPSEVCTSLCTECDFYSATGVELGYIESCNDLGCISKEV
jgi:hypothetical protein